jgi:hypothetical protein
MLVEATHVERKKVTVDVDAVAVIDKLQRFWQNSIGHCGRYINRDNQWEDWTDTGHGSGLTERFGPATAEQIAMVASFANMRVIAAEYRKKHS